MRRRGLALALAGMAALALLLLERAGRFPMDPFEEEEVEPWWS